MNEFAPSNKIELEPSGILYRALVGPYEGKIGERLKVLVWGGMMLQFEDGVRITYAITDVTEIGRIEREG